MSIMEQTNTAKWGVVEGGSSKGRADSTWEEREIREEKEGERKEEKRNVICAWLSILFMILRKKGYSFHCVFNSYIRAIKR